jgi:probable HAF family extracellular repeat protein
MQSSVASRGAQLRRADATTAGVSAASLRGHPLLTSLCRLCESLERIDGGLGMRSYKSKSISGFGLFVFAMLMADLAAAGSLTDVGTLGGVQSFVVAINNAGQIVGQSSPAGDAEMHAFLYSNGVMTDLGTLGGTSSFATAINSSGQVVGRSTTAGGEEHAFLYSGGTMTDLGTLGGTGSRASAINDAGQVVGAAYTAGNAEQHAFLYSGGVMTDLGTLGGTFSSAVAINEAGQVAGTSDTLGDAETHAFLYTGGVMTDLGTLGGTFSDAYDMNAAGQVVGHSRTAGFDTHAFLYDGGVMTDLGTLGGEYSRAVAINDSGEVAGFSTTPSPGLHAFRYSGGVMTDLGEVFDAPLAINNAGQIAGSAVFAGDAQPHAFLHSGGVMTDLGTLGWTYSVAVGLNDAGQVIGDAQLSESFSFVMHGFLLACPLTPAATCLGGPKASLQVIDNADDTKDQIKWRWAGGPAVSQVDLGDPQSDTPYTLCVYDSTSGTDVLVDNLRIDPNVNWTDKDPRGWSYKDTLGAESSVSKAQIKTGDAGKTKVQIRAKGPSILLSPPFDENEFFDQGTRVTVQLFNDATSTCWTSEFTTATKNDSTKFKAKTP